MQSTITWRSPSERPNVPYSRRDILFKYKDRITTIEFSNGCDYWIYWFDEMPEDLIGWCYLSDIT